MKLGITITLLASCCAAYSAELVHSFNSPAFSGAGWSSHVLTLKQLEDQQRDKNRAAADAIKAKAENDAQNTPQARFIANLESRVYSQLAKQLTDSLFGDGNSTPLCSALTAGQVCGIIPDLAGNTVTWRLGVGSDTGLIIITITNLANPQQTTTMKIPVGTFSFGGP